MSHIVIATYRYISNASIFIIADPLPGMIVKYIELYPGAAAKPDNYGYFPLNYRPTFISRCVELYPAALVLADEFSLNESRHHSEMH
jgi:hypothetical protein